MKLQDRHLTISTPTYKYFQTVNCILTKSERTKYSADKENGKNLVSLLILFSDSDNPLVLLCVSSTESLRLHAYLCGNRSDVCGSCIKSINFRM